MMAHQNRPAPSLRAARPEVSEALDAIYLRMMAKRPGDRPQTMSEVILALESCRTSAREAGDVSADLKTFAHTIMKRAPERKRRGPDASIFARPAPQTDGLSFNPDLSLEDLIADHREDIHPEPLTEDRLPPRPPRIRPARTTGRQRIHPALIGLAAAIALFVLRYVLLPRDASKPIETLEIGLKSKPEPEPDLSPPTGFAESIGVKIVPIPPGEFWMGMSDEEITASLKGNPSLKPADYDSARPRHRVRITQLQGLSAHEITLGQFRRFVEDTGYRPESERDGNTSTAYDPVTWQLVRNAKITWKDDGFHPSDDHPVTCVSWNDATEFCQWLSRKDGRTYRLPTEAEWEYCCRAGSESLFSNGNDQERMVEIANVADATHHANLPKTPALDGNDGYASTAPVGRFAPNAWGLYDMHGNVWEWCQDFHDAAYYATSPPTDPPGPTSGKARIVRGGSWVDIGVPSASRNPITPGFLIANIGFRVALDQSTPAAPMATVTAPEPAPAPTPTATAPEQGNVLLSEDFNTPDPAWKQSSSEDIAANHGAGFANGAWFVTSNGKAQYSWSVPGGPYPEIEVEFAVKVLGDGNPDPRGGGLIHLFSDMPGQVEDRTERGIQLRINGAGQLVLEPSFWTATTYPNGPWRGPINHPALKPAGQTNILKLRVHKRQLELFANGQPVGDPIDFDWDLTPARLSLGADSWTGVIRAEFDRFEIRKLPPTTDPAPAPKPRSNVLLSENFDVPNPTWQQSGQDAFANNWGCGFANGAWFAMSNTDAQYSWPVPGGPYPEMEVEFAVKITGDGNSDPRGGGLIHLFSDVPGQTGDKLQRGIQLRINGAGQLVLEPSFWTATTYPNGPWRGPINHPALKPAGQTNILKLRVHKRQLELFANNRRVGAPIPFDWDLTPARMSLGADSWTGTIRAAFDRFEIRELNPPPR
jgi:formylglycine-generating enzyme required for sulfatase activity